MDQYNYESEAPEQLCNTTTTSTITSITTTIIIIMNRV
jgi:hypothetical protein